MQNETLLPTPYSLTPRPNRFWRGVFAGAMLVLSMFVGLIMIGEHMNAGHPTDLENTIACQTSLQTTLTKLNQVESKWVVIYEFNERDVPAIGYHNLVEIRPGAAIASTLPHTLKPRWIVAPGELPIDIWREGGNTAYAFYDPHTRMTTPVHISGEQVR